MSQDERLRFAEVVECACVLLEALERSTILESNPILDKAADDLWDALPKDSL